MSYQLRIATIESGDSSEVSTKDFDTSFDFYCKVSKTETDIYYLFVGDLNIPLPRHQCQIAVSVYRRGHIWVLPTIFDIAPSPTLPRLFTRFFNGVINSISVNEKEWKLESVKLNLSSQMAVVEKEWSGCQSDKSCIQKWNLDICNKVTEKRLQPLKDEIERATFKLQRLQKSRSKLERRLLKARHTDTERLSYLSFVSKVRKCT